MKPVGETEFVNGIAAMSASGLYGSTRIAAGIVGTADLTLGDAVAPVLEAHIRAGGGRFRGIRHSAAWDPAGEAIASRMAQPHLYMDANFRIGYAHLARFEMTFEGWCYHHQIKELTDLAQAFPDTTIILDHFGGPLGIGPYAGKRDELLGPWRQDISELATCPNVVAKLGGINMSINGGWLARRADLTGMEATRPLLRSSIGGSLHVRVQLSVDKESTVTTCCGIHLNASPLTSADEKASFITIPLEYHRFRRDVYCSVWQSLAAMNGQGGRIITYSQDILASSSEKRHIPCSIWPSRIDCHKNSHFVLVKSLD